jgi:ProQ/FINO family
MQPNPHETIEFLASTWPNCFRVKPRERVPLKVGIGKDLAAAAAGAITDEEISVAMRVYVGNKRYLKALREGAARIDLHGNPAGVVTAKGGRLRQDSDWQDRRPHVGRDARAGLGDRGGGPQGEGRGRGGQAGSRGGEARRGGGLRQAQAAAADASSRHGRRHPARGLTRIHERAVPGRRPNLTTPPVRARSIGGRLAQGRRLCRVSGHRRTCQ